MSFIVSVIIPTYRDWNRLALCLEALQKQSFPQEKFEVLVVNNDPEEPIPAGFTFSQNVKFLQEVKPGSYAARNTALQFASGNIIGFTDSDCIPDKDWIKNAVEFLHKNKDISRVAGPVQIQFKSTTPTVIEKYNEIFAFPQLWLIKNGGGSVTANLFVYKSVFSKIGCFDETIMSMGDKYWGMKAEAAGYKIAYAENVLVLHPPRNLSELIKKEKRHGGAVEINTSSGNKKLYNLFLSELLPKPSNYRFIFSKRKDLRIMDRLAIPILRHFLLVVRAYESLKVQQGKKPIRN